MANKVPKIRFKGFTDDWEQRKLGDVFEQTSNFVNPNEHDIELWSLTVEDGLTPKSERYNREFLVKKEDNFKEVRPGDIVYNPMNMTLGAVGYNAMGKSVAVSGYYTTMIAKENNDAYYINTWLKSPQALLLYKTYATGSLIEKQRVQFPTLSIIPASFPSFAEQQKIGKYFEELDNLITLHQRKCDQTKELKKFMLQKMFPKKGEKNPEIRFPGFTDDWEQRKLGDFGLATGGTSIESEFSANGKYKVISIGSYSEDSAYRDQGIRAVESEKTKTRVLNEGDLTMILNDKTSSGNIIGRALLIEKSGVYVYNQRTERIEIYSDEYDSLFIYEMLNAPQIRDKIIRQSQGNTQIYVNWTNIVGTNYLVPKIDEQRKIGMYFKRLDNLITLHQRKCEQLKELKKFMLQNMFPKKG